MPLLPIEWIFSFSSVPFFASLASIKMCSQPKMEMVVTVLLSVPTKQKRMRIKPINVMGRFHIYSVVFISFSHFLCALFFFISLFCHVILCRREGWVFPLQITFFFFFIIFSLDIFKHNIKVKIQIEKNASLPKMLLLCEW